MLLIWLLTFVGCALAQWDPHFVPGHAGIVHLFEWHWETIAEECETLLGPNKWGGVQISPPTENRIVVDRPWWERYQPVSYIMSTRSGDRGALHNMINRCNDAGVRIYADIVINHMCRGVENGTGTGGSYFDPVTKDFPAVPYSSLDFNDANCKSASGNIENYHDPNQVRNCRLQKLLDLNQGKKYVRGKIIAMMNDLIGMGVAGFRVDACKHMWPGDLKAIFESTNNLTFGGRPFIYQEVIDQGGEPITANQYFGLGRVTEFKYGIKISENKNKIQYLSNFGELWGMMPNGSALCFLNNHDNQRGHGGGGHIITFKDPQNLKIFTAFMMAWPYGVPRVMSSYYFNNSDQGPPPNQRSVNADGSCGNRWVCEHRWRQIKNMAAFAVAASGQPVSNWWTNGDNQIAFSRGSKAFLAINKAGNVLSEHLQTGLPGGNYCNVNAADVAGCGNCVNVDSNGYASITIYPSEDPVVALHVDAPCNCSAVDCTASTNPPPTVNCTDCNHCSQKVDCGYKGINQGQCVGKGCLWCPDYTGHNIPWCIKRTSCQVNDSSKRDCGYFGVDQSQCEAKGCCWAESNTNGVPWCFHPA